MKRWSIPVNPARILVSSVFLLLFLPLFLSQEPWPTTARDILADDAETQTGAENIVSAIYLGYRAFDTLGETIVLLIALSGTMSVVSLLKRNSEDVRTPVSLDFSLEEEKRAHHRLRTHLLEVVTGKIGPIILLFGFYVVMHGHLSPGGGFQGGAIIASGIIFFVLGNPHRREESEFQRTTLHLIESGAFLLFLLAALVPLFMTGEVLANPFEEKEIYIIALNTFIGLKVGAGISLMCISMIERRNL